jgi:hypothetical protein
MSHLFRDHLSEETIGDSAVKNTYEQAVLETYKKFFAKDLKEAFKEGDFNRLVKLVVHLKKNNHTRTEIKYFLCLTESELRKIERSLASKKSK